MILIRNILAALTLLLLVLNQVDAECCTRNDNYECGDRTKGVGWPSPCCGVGDCNVFCCNCDGGCREDDNRWPDFNTGEYGVKWSSNCDFPGNDIDNRVIDVEQCGRICTENSGCTSFSHHHGTCYLKNHHPGLGKQPADGGLCGFLPWKF